MSDTATLVIVAIAFLEIVGLVALNIWYWSLTPEERAFYDDDNYW